MFYKETKFKNTLIGKIPEDWLSIQLKETLTLKNGERPTFLEKGNIPIYGANGVMGFTNEYLVDNKFTIIFGRVGASGEVHLGKGKIWVSDNAIYSKNYAEGKIYLPFIFYFLKLKNLKQFASKTTHPIITQTFLNNLQIPLPPFPEQQKISDILSTVDEAIQKTNEIIAKIERLKKGLMQELLTKGIGHKEFKYSKELGYKIPKEWEVVRLGDILSLEYGEGLPEKERALGKYPVVGSNGIVGYHNKKLINGPGIVIGRKGTIGAVSWLEQDFWPIDTTYYVKPKISDVNLKWLFFELVHLNLARIHLADVVPGLKRELVYPLKVLLPSFPEQQKIASILSTVDKRLQVEREEKQRLERIKKGLMDLLLTGKIRVKV
ncbi:MAG: restriction endonuclease subunit S [Candidatus Altiarchaeota archaeon]